MILYLVQHGESRPESEDPERSLTDRGRDDVRAVAGEAARLGVRPAAVFHSGKARARQTAEILAESLVPPQGVLAHPGLAPNDPVPPWKERLESSTEDILIAGHLPFLERLASLLLSGDEARGVVRFRQGAVACLERAEGRWAIRWILTPEMAHG